MTTPGGHGSPDFQKPVQWRTTNLLGVTSLDLATGTYNYGPYLVQGWQGISVILTPSIGNGSIDIKWYNDSGLTEFIRSDTYQVNGNTGLNVMMPVFGPYLEIVIVTQSVTNMAATVWVVAQNVPTPTIYYPLTKTYISGNSVSIAASGSETYYLPHIRKGQAFFWFHPNDSSGQVAINIQATSTGVTYSDLIYFALGPTTDLSFLLVLPDEPIRVVFTNSDTANAHKITFSLITDSS